MTKGVELHPYSPDDLFAAAQVVREILTTPPLAMTESLSDIISMLQSDQTRPGFGGLLCKAEPGLLGVAWWFAISGRELNDRWRPRFVPRESVPHPSGRGIYIQFLGVLPTYRGRGLGTRLLSESLALVEAGCDWLATQWYRQLNADFLIASGFEVLPLTGTQSVDRSCLLKMMTAPA